MWRVWLLLLLALGAGASGQGFLLPKYWSSSFSGVFYQSFCRHSGMMYYDGVKRHLRTDWVLGYKCGATGNAFQGKQVINDGYKGQLRNYRVPNGTSTFQCNVIPASGWWRYDYLEHETPLNTTTIEYLGVKEMEVDLYNSTGLFVAGYVLSYVERDHTGRDPITGMVNGTLRRIEVRQGPHEDYWLDFVGFQAAGDVREWGPQPFAGIAGMPCRKG